MNTYYYTEDLRLKNDILEYKHKEDFTKVKKHNWHHILTEYGWEKINKQWVILLNKYSDNKEKNSRYSMIDCERDGDCFFHCIANALNERDIYTGDYYVASDIRKMISNNISREQYKFMISTYRCMKDADDFNEGWDPYEIDSLEDASKMKPFKCCACDSAFNLKCFLNIHVRKVHGKDKAVQNQQM